MDILTILIPPIYEHQSISFYLFLSSSVSFIDVLYQVQIFYLLRFVPRHFICFDIIINGIVFFISLSDSSLLVYKNATDFYMLIQYPAILLNSLVSYSSFLVASLEFSMYSIISSANNDHFTSSFSVSMPFYFFFFFDCCG